MPAINLMMMLKRIKMNGSLKSSRWLFCLLLCGLFACESEKNPAPIDCNNSDLDLSISSVTDASCTGADGSVTVTASGGQSPFQYRINTNDFQSSNIFEGLSPGTYSVTVKDQVNCEQTISAEVMAEGSSLAFNSISSTDSGCKTANATVTVEATGEGTVEYKLNDGSFQTSNIFENVMAGVHDVVIKDAAECEATGQVQVRTGVSYNSQVKTIITSNCAISGCHDGSGTSPNLTVFSNVQNSAANIKSRTQSGEMPPAGSGKTLTQEQKDLIACWVDDGALDN